MLPGLLGLLFESCLPLLMLFYYYWGLPQAVLAMHISASPLCVHLPLIPAELSRRFGLLLRRPRCLHLPASAGCSPRALEKHSPSYFGWLCSFGFLVYFPERFHSIPHGGLAALNSLHLLLQKLSVSLQLDVSPIFSASCVRLSGPLNLLPAPQRGDRVSRLREE